MRGKKIILQLLWIGNCFGTLTGWTQDLKKIKEFNPGKIENVAVDRLGNFFLVLENGSIVKYDSSGHVVATLKKGTRPTLIQPWYHPQVFIYEQAHQQWTMYDRKLENPDENKIDPAVAIDPALVCPTNDHRLLVLDAADLSVKKINPFTAQLISEFTIDSTSFQTKPHITFLCDYQNLMFLLDANSGILIYNAIGQKVNHILCSARNFGFYGEELYYLQQDKIIFFDLYTEKKREIKTGSGKFAIVTDCRIFLVKENDNVLVFENPGDQ